MSVVALAFLLFCPPSSGRTTCTCVPAKLTHSWCDACSVGFVASFAVESADLYETIHPHGHIVDPALTRCENCRKAIREDSWCGECNAGYIAGQAYFSKLTYLLIQGRTLDPATLACATCRKHAQRHGWCDACKAGWVGNVRFDSRALFDKAAHEIDIFFTARETVDKCVVCAQAMITSTYCPLCRITYHDGQPVAPRKTPSPR